MANKTTYPGWGDMLRTGATTIYEAWDMDNSLCHSSYLYIGTWFIEGLAGIKSDLRFPGFRRFVLKPGIVDDPSLTWVKANHESLYGPIVSNWKIDDAGVLTWNVTIPPNTTATVFLPTTDVKTVAESAQPLASAKGVKVVESRPNQLTLEVQPGSYEFKSAVSLQRKL